MTTGFNDATAAEYLKYLVDAAGVVVWEYDWASDRFTYVSQTADGMLGYSRSEWLEPGFWVSHVHSDDRERVIAQCVAATEAGEDHILEYRMLRADGSSAWMREIVVVDPVMKLQGHNRGLLIDVTAQQDAIVELENIERRYRAMISSAGLAVVEISTGGSIDYANQAAATILGVKREDLIGTRAWQLIPHENRPAAITEFRRALASGDFLTDYVLPLAARDGDERIVRINSALLHDAAGDVRGTVTIGEDITESIKLERALHRKVEDFEAVFRLMTDLYFRMDANGIYVDYAVDEHSKLFAPPEMFIGRHYSEVLPPQIADLVTVGIAEAHATGMMAVVEYSAPLDDEIRSYEARLLPLPDGETATVVRDVTVRIQREHQLESSERRLRSVVENAPLGMHFFEVEPDGRMVLSDANPAADTILGIEHAALIGLDIEEAFPSLRGSAIPATYRYLAQKGGSWRTDSVNYEDDQLVGAFEIVAFQIAPNRIATMFSDVTERQVLAKKEKEYQARLRAMTTELTDAEARERRQLAEELHDRVSQALAVARMHLDSACASESPDRDGVNRARALLETAIRETRAITTELAPPVLYELGLGSALRWVCENISETHGLEIGLNLDFDERVLSDDRKMTLFRATRELLVNIVKHAETGNAWVELSNTESSVRLTVADQGLGFDSNALGDDTAGGFGLFSIKERLHSMGGTFNMHSSPGGGTVVTITVPCQGPDSSARA